MSLLSTRDQPTSEPFKFIQIIFRSERVPIKYEGCAGTCYRLQSEQPVRLMVTHEITAFGCWVFLFMPFLSFSDHG